LGRKDHCKGKVYDVDARATGWQMFFWSMEEKKVQSVLGRKESAVKKKSRGGLESAVEEVF